jgi:hypothetical protein
MLFRMKSEKYKKATQYQGFPWKLVPGSASSSDGTKKPSFCTL